MDLLSLLRTLGGLGVVLGILAGALWLVRRYDLRLPGRAIGARDRRLELIETLPIDGRRMVALLRRDGREHLVLIAPEGHLILESGVVPDAADRAATDTRRAAREAAASLREVQRQAAAQIASESFAVLVDRVRARTVPGVRALRAVLDRATPATSAPAPPPASMPLAVPAECADAATAKLVRKRRAPQRETSDA
ncbi:flagellar biosynthetic protein FliO [Sphingomonas sp. PAMC 26621]|uniref:flagellar biosynthetic protein FliO n=1 Tax=Sphingomonas sp. PAMC 26621 TaxID=1112213 RepID=UPI0002883CC7|nr:flagellar biosynthetic protein FliO [Sphingomonas sp. PAMC 26621]